MPVCSVQCCKSNHLTTSNGMKMQFFSLPSIKKLCTRVDARGQRLRERSVLSNKQREAWIHALKTSEDKLQEKNKYSYNIRLCAKHFHPSVLSIHPNKGITLQDGACPTLYLSTFSMNNEQYAENKALPRTVASKDSSYKLQPIMTDHEASYAKNVDNNIVNKIIECNQKQSRVKRRQVIKNASEKIQKLEYEQLDAITSLNKLQQKFPSLHHQWKIRHNENMTKLSRIISSSTEEHEAIQEIFITNNLLHNSIDIKIFTPINYLKNNSNVFDSDDDISTIEVKITKITSISKITHFIQEIIKIEKSYSPFNENDYSSNECLLLHVKRLANAEQEKGNLLNNAFYSFIGEQIQLHSTPIRKRLYEKDSFTLACGHQLYSCSSNHYDKLRKKCNFIILPDKRTLFSNGHKSVPLDLIFSSKKNSGHTIILKKICHQLSRSTKTTSTGYKVIEQRRMMSLHLDEINVKSTNAFSNKCNLFGPSHNKYNELATSVQVFLISTLTGNKTCLNLNSIPVHNMESEYLEQKLLECLDKARQEDFEIIPIIIDWVGKNEKNDKNFYSA